MRDVLLMWALGFVSGSGFSGNRELRLTDSKGIETKNGNRVLKVAVSEIQDKHGSRLVTFSRTEIQDRAGKRLFKLTANEIQDASGNRLYRFSPTEVQDKHGRALYKLTAPVPLAVLVALNLL
jgi:hypothetical protein